jgi:hypothetical protein
MTTLEILREAYKLIEKPKHWTQYVHARGSLGEAVSPGSDLAVCFCAAGAIVRAAMKMYPNQSLPYYIIRYEVDRDIQQSIKELKYDLGQPLSEFNDTRSHADVLAAFRRTIARLEAKGTSRPILPPSNSFAPSLTSFWARRPCHES